MTASKLSSFLMKSGTIYLAMSGITPALSEPMDDAAVTARATEIVAKMTDEEKAGQLFTVTSFIPSPDIDPVMKEAIIQGRVGGYYLLHDPAQINRLQRLAVEESRLGIPIIFALDVVHGFRTIFPVPIGLAASWDPALVERVNASAASEARAAGIQWTFSPNVDIARDVRWGRMVEGAGEDPYLGSIMAGAQVRGFQGPYVGAPNHIIASPKHFAGYGASVGGRDYEEVELSDNQLWNVYLPPFKAAIDAGAHGIMAAYMPLNGVPAVANHWLLTDVLYKKWKFKGFVVSDAVSVSSLVTQGVAVDKTDAAARALNAGLTMELGLPEGAFGGEQGALVEGSALASLPQAKESGMVTQDAIDDAARKVIETKIRMGLFEHPYVDEDAAERAFSNPERRNLARLAAERSAVLLRNDGGLLPFDPKRIKSLAVIGPLADSEKETEGPWVFKPTPDAVTIVEGLRAKLGNAVEVNYVPGVRIPPRRYPRMIDPPEPESPPIDEAAEIDRAVKAADAADVAIVVVGERSDMIGENASRATLDLPGRQQEMLDAVVATGTPVVVLVMSGRPLDLKDTQAKAIMAIWYPGSEGGDAVANLLFGDAAPGGKLPFTWPQNAGQAPMTYAHLTSHDPAGADTRYWDIGSKPTWNFGYGLSYSEFAFSDISVDRFEISPNDTVMVSATVSNTGTRVADEVAQIYIHQRSGAARPVRELKGFQRLTLRPGEKKQVTFAIGPDERNYWSTEHRDWVQDASVFDVWIGSDSTASLGTQFAVSADAATSARD